MALRSRSGTVHGKRITLTIRCGEPPAGNFAGAAGSLFEAKTLVGGDAKRVAGVSRRLEQLRGKWMDAVRGRARAAGADEQRFYDVVEKDLAEMVRTLGVSREQILAEFQKGM